MSTAENIKSLDDAGLVNRYKQTGNNRYVGELYERYTHLVYGVCMKYLENTEDSRDATLEIFEKLMEDLKRHDVANFKAWLYSVTKNHCMMKFRKDKMRVERRPELHEELSVVMEWKEDLHLNNGVEREEKLGKVEEAIRQLPKDQKNCIELFYLQDKTYQQIMKETGFDFRQVKSYIQNGKRNLKNLLDGQQ